MRRHALPLLLLALVALTGWLLSRVSEDETPAGKARRHEPDYYLERFTRTRVGGDGQVRDRLRAELLVHYDDDGSTELVQPVLDIYNERGEPWHVIADRGWVSEDNDVILLYGAVTAWRDDPEGNRELELQTRDLKLLRDERYAESDHPTTLRDRTTTTYGVGMRADFGIDRIDLLKDVRSRHEPKPDH